MHQDTTKRVLLGESLGVCRVGHTFQRHLIKTLYVALLVLGGDSFKEKCKSNRSITIKIKKNTAGPRAQTDSGCPNTVKFNVLYAGALVSRSGPFQQSHLIHITKKADQTLDLTTDQWAIAEETATILMPFITITGV